MHGIKPLAFDLLPLPRGLGVVTLSDGTAIGRFLSTDLSSVFQPLIDSGSGRCAGHEAFVRADGQGELDITPWNLFSLVDNDDALVVLDRLCRTVHVLNFLRVADVPGRLFLTKGLDTPARAFLERVVSKKPPFAVSLSNRRFHAAHWPSTSSGRTGLSLCLNG